LLSQKDSAPGSQNCDDWQKTPLFGPGTGIGEHVSSGLQAWGTHLLFWQNSYPPGAHLDGVPATQHVSDEGGQHWPFTTYSCGQQPEARQLDVVGQHFVVLSEVGQRVFPLQGFIGGDGSAQQKFGRHIHSPLGQPEIRLLRGESSFRSMMPSAPGAARTVMASSAEAQRKSVYRMVDSVWFGKSRCC
jgi:hypothetical protein